MPCLLQSTSFAVRHRFGNNQQIKESAIMEADENFDLFLQSLTDLCRRHSFGLNGEITVYVMEKEDFSFEMNVDKNSRLLFY